MACPGGCIGGGGQPRARDADILAKRMSAIYGIDQGSALRASHLNPQIQELYAKVLKEPGSQLAHEMLHTSYSARSCSDANHGK
jgi:iron only hydrogenase large subunit-like protein